MKHIIYTYLWAIRISIRVFYIYFPIWLKFSARYLQKTLLAFVSLLKIRRWEGRVFLLM